MNDLLCAVALLTRMPTPGRAVDSSAAPGRSLAWFPLVGAGIGLVLAAALYLLRALFSGEVAAALVVALWVGMTGALHLDGLADSCDALFAAVPRERRLEILQDVQVGSFGVVGLVLLLVAKFAAVGDGTGFAAIFLAPVLGRWAMVYAAAHPLARTNGMAAAFGRGLNRSVILVATLCAGLVSALFGRLGLAALVASLVVATLVARFAMRQLGGLTGDVYGAICETVELTVLLVGGLNVWRV